jgi:hypothetical protein
MQNLKKLLASMSVVFVVLSNLLPVVTYGQSYNPEQVAAHEWAYKNGLTSMSSIAGFMPNSTLTREALARFMVKFYEEILGRTDKVPGQDCTFKDMNQVDPTLQSFVTKACQYGIMKGSSGMFMPKATVNRAVMFTVVSRALYGSMYDSSSSNYWVSHYNALKQAGIATVENAMANVLRIDSVIMLKRAAELNQSDDLADLLSGLL